MGGFFWGGGASPDIKDFNAEFKLQCDFLRKYVFESKEYQTLLKRVDALEKEVTVLRAGGLEGSKRNKIKVSVVQGLVGTGIEGKVAENVFNKVVEEIGFKAGETRLLKECLKAATQ